MALQPRGSLLTFSGTGINAPVFIDGDAQKQIRVIDFDRKEFSNAYLFNLPEEDGSEPILVKNMVGNYIQFNFACGSATSIRSSVPDDNNVDNIMQSMIIKSYQIKGGPSAPSSVDAIYQVAYDHARRIKSFDGYQKLFSQRLSWQFVKNLQNQNFSYLTNTGLNVAGAVCTENNILIRSFNKGFTHENPRDRTIVACDWSMVIDVINIESLRNYTG